MRQLTDTLGGPLNDTRSGAAFETDNGSEIGVQPNYTHQTHETHAGRGVSLVTLVQPGPKFGRHFTLATPRSEGENMRLQRRLQKLEQLVPGPDLLAVDPEYECWRTFYESALDILKPFPDALKKVEENMSVQEPCFFRTGEEPGSAEEDLRFYFCKESLWATLVDFPEAKGALDDFLVLTFSNCGLSNADKQKAEALRFKYWNQSLRELMEESPITRQSLHEILVAAVVGLGVG